MEVILSLIVTVIGVFLGFSASIAWERKKENKRDRANAHKLDKLLSISLNETKERIRLIDSEITDQNCPTINFDWRVFDLYRTDYPVGLANTEVYEKLGILISMLQSMNQHVTTMGSMFGSGGSSSNFVTMRIQIGNKKTEIHNHIVRIEKMVDRDRTPHR